MSEKRSNREKKKNRKIKPWGTRVEKRSEWREIESERARDRVGGGGIRPRPSESSAVEPSMRWDSLVPDTVILLSTSLRILSILQSKGENRKKGEEKELKCGGRECILGGETPFWFLSWRSIRCSSIMAEIVVCSILILRGIRSLSWSVRLDCPFHRFIDSPFSLFPRLLCPHHFSPNFLGLSYLSFKSWVVRCFLLFFYKYSVHWLEVSLLVGCSSAHLYRLCSYHNAPWVEEVQITTYHVRIWKLLLWVCGNPFAVLYRFWFPCIEFFNHFDGLRKWYCFALVCLFVLCYLAVKES